MNTQPWPPLDTRPAVALQVPSDDPEKMFTRLPNLPPDPGLEASVHRWAVRAARRFPIISYA